MSNTTTHEASMKLLNIKEVAKALQCSPRVIAAWTASGELVSVKLGRLRRYRPEDVGAFIQRNLSASSPDDAQLTP